MPNWCQNWLTIVGPEEDLKKFETLLNNEGEFDFRKLVPVPEEETDSMDWYMRHLKYWGTKWGEGEAYFNKIAPIKNTPLKVLSLGMETAWSPPINFIILASDRFPNLLFDMTYDEGGADFAGHIQVMNGNVLVSDEGVSLSNRCYDYDEETGESIENGLTYEELEPTWFPSNEELANKLQEEVKKLFSCGGK